MLAVIRSESRQIFALMLHRGAPVVVVAGAELVVDVIVVKDEVDAAEVVGKEDEVELSIGPTDELDELADEEDAPPAVEVVVVEVSAAVVVVVVAPPLLEVVVVEVSAAVVVVVVAPPLLEVEDEVLVAEVDDVLVELVGAKTQSEKDSISTTSNLRCRMRTMGLSQVSGAT